MRITDDLQSYPNQQNLSVEYAGPELAPRHDGCAYNSRSHVSSENVMPNSACGFAATRRNPAR